MQLHSMISYIKSLYQITEILNPQMSSWSREALSASSVQNQASLGCSAIFGVSQSGLETAIK
jgi:hypothetical protein